MPAHKTSRLPGLLRDDYAHTLQEARQYFKFRTVGELGALVRTFIPVNWAQYRNAQSTLSVTKVRLIMAVLQRLKVVVPDAQWWRQSASVSQRIAIHMRATNRGPRSRYAWAVAFLDFASRALPLTQYTCDIYWLDATGDGNEVTINLSSNDQGNWRVTARPAEFGLALFLERRVGFASQAASYQPMLAGNWTQEFWLRAADLLTGPIGEAAALRTLRTQGC